MGDYSRIGEQMDSQAEPGEVKSSEERRRLLRQAGELECALPRTMAGLGRLQREAFKDGALSGRVKELMAVGMSIVTHCDGCVQLHVHQALVAGATREELLETISVAILMGGGPAAISGAEALELIDELLGDASD
jgi:AhpD family alkylhydroperoxidase